MHLELNCPASYTCIQFTIDCIVIELASAFFFGSIIEVARPVTNDERHRLILFTYSLKRFSKSSFQSYKFSCKKHCTDWAVVSYAFIYCCILFVPFYSPVVLLKKNDFTFEPFYHIQ